MKDNQPTPVSRKRFMLGGLGLLAGLSLLRFLGISRTRERPRTVRMLSQDGQLVEVDVSRLPAGKRKATNRDLQHWIRRKPHTPS
ncbi:MAG TPA: hypothetical protein VG870_12475 [Chitinophagaceae bacterium]|nr:hypothetical protein [Chitinophagaceae bacterium]